LTLAVDSKATSSKAKAPSFGKAYGFLTRALTHISERIEKRVKKGKVDFQFHLSRTPFYDERKSFFSAPGNGSFQMELNL